MKKLMNLSTRPMVATFTKMNKALVYLSRATAAAKYSDTDKLEQIEWAVPQFFRDAFEKKSYVPWDHNMKRFIKEYKILERQQTKEVKKKECSEKKKRKEQKMNARIRSAQLAQAEGIGEEVMTGPESLFTLTGIKTTKISDVDVPDSEAEESESEQDRDSDDSSDSDLDEQRRKYDEQMDRHLEKSYQDWKIRQRMTQGGALKKKRKRLGMDGELESSGDDDEEDRPVDEKESSHDTEQDVSSDEGDLLVDLDTEKQKIKPVDAWFSQDIFNGEVEEESTDSESGPSLQGNGNVVSESSEEEQIEPSIPQEPGKNTDFEIVPLSGDESDSAAEEFEDMDDEAKAEVLALAKKFIRKKSKGELIEAAYNRYALYVKSILPCVN